MTLPNNFLTILDGVIWIVCILMGMVFGSFLCRYVGTFLGWMIANSLDESIIRGGKVGRQVGKLAGVALGAGLGVYGALHAVAFVTPMFSH